jgi:hypothetical protein
VPYRILIGQPPALRPTQGARLGALITENELNTKIRSDWPACGFIGILKPVMPFPLAHPAAVLPLRRFCPQRLSFAALVIGSLSPDVGYYFGCADFSHSFFPGSIEFCLPVGLLLLTSFYALRRPLVALLPGRLKQVFLPPCQKPAGSLFSIVLSLLIGAWTHLLLDSMAHEDGWLAERTPLLQKSVPLPWTSGIKGYDALYAVCTLFGVAWLANCYWRWLERAVGLPTFTKPWVRRGFSLLFAFSILGVAAASRGGRRLIGNFPLAIITLLLVIVFLLGTATPFITLPANE